MSWGVMSTVSMSLSCSSYRMSSNSSPASVSSALSPRSSYNDIPGFAKRQTALNICGFWRSLNRSVARDGSAKRLNYEANFLFVAVFAIAGRFS